MLNFARVKRDLMAFNPNTGFLCEELPCSLVQKNSFKVKAQLIKVKWGKKCVM